jgi:hypothetical protein
MFSLVKKLPVCKGNSQLLDEAETKRKATSQRMVPKVSILGSVCESADGRWGGGACLGGSVTVHVRQCMVLFSSVYTTV